MTCEPATPARTSRRRPSRSSASSSASIPAEFGGRAGGVVNVVTKSGTNRFSGEAFEFFRNKTLNRSTSSSRSSTTRWATPSNDFRRDQFGVSLGGPIVRDRVHFFASLERTDSQEFFTVNTGKPQFYSAPRGRSAAAPATCSSCAATVQLNAVAASVLPLLTQDATYYAEGGGGTNAASAPATRCPDSRTSSATPGVLSPSVVNEFAAMYAESYQDTPLNERYTPAAYPRRSAAPRYVFPSLTWGAGPGTHFGNGTGSSATRCRSRRAITSGSSAAASSGSRL